MRRLFLLFGSTVALLVACTTNGDPPATSVLAEPAPSTTVEPTDPGPSLPRVEAGTSSADRDADTAADAPAAPLDAGREAESVSTNRACVDYARPTTFAACRGCPAGRTCQSNGCWGDYWCDVPILRCVPQPTAC